MPPRPSLGNFPIDIPIRLKLVTSPKRFEKDVFRLIGEELDDRFTRAIPKVLNDIRTNFGRIFVKSPTYIDIVNGTLGPALGIPAGEAAQRLDAIIRAMESSVQMKYTKIVGKNGRLEGGLEIYAIYSDFADLLNLKEATIINQANTQFNGLALAWLDWLLLQGDKIIISDYIVRYGNYAGNSRINSRSGEAIMVKKPGDYWKVPAEHSGTIDDNWIIRAIDDSYSFLDKLFKASIERHLKSK